MSISYVVACVAVPVAWGAAVHWLFASWHERQAARRTAIVHDEEAEEPNVP
jgi:hypothetical protein